MSDENLRANLALESAKEAKMKAEDAHIFAKIATVLSMVAVALALIDMIWR